MCIERVTYTFLFFKIVVIIVFLRELLFNATKATEAA